MSVEMAAAVAAVSKRLVWEYRRRSLVSRTNETLGETKGPNLIRASGIMCTHCFNWSVPKPFVISLEYATVVSPNRFEHKDNTF